MLAVSSQLKPTSPGKRGSQVYKIQGYTRLRIWGKDGGPRLHLKDKVVLLLYRF